MRATAICACVIDTKFGPSANPFCERGCKGTGQVEVPEPGALVTEDERRGWLVDAEAADEAA